jgi:hypothetical protein
MKVFNMNIIYQNIDLIYNICSDKLTYAVTILIN